MCNCFEIKIQELQKELYESHHNIVEINSTWSDTALNFNDVATKSLSIKSIAMVHNSTHEFPQLLELTNSLTLKFCPFCGLELPSHPKNVHNAQEIQEQLQQLEERLEEKFENITISSIDALIQSVQEEMDTLDFTIKRFDEDMKIKIICEHDDDYSIELYLEDDDYDDVNNNGYVVNIF
jgi:DNA repair exonuclease SbcCD ATPase subunit